MIIGYGFWQYCVLSYKHRYVYSFFLCCYELCHVKFCYCQCVCVCALVSVTALACNTLPFGAAILFLYSNMQNSLSILSMNFSSQTNGYIETRRENVDFQFAFDPFKNFPISFSFIVVHLAWHFFSIFNFLCSIFFY